MAVGAPGYTAGHNGQVQAIGAGAVNQAVKAVVLATGYLREDGIHVHCVPEFAEVTIEDKERTAIKLVVEPGGIPNSSEITNKVVERESLPNLLETGS